MAAGVRSPLAPWIGGAGASPAQAGVRSLFAPWIGGAGVSPTQAGVRGLLAFWLGGASVQARGRQRQPPPGGISQGEHLRRAGNRYERARIEERHRAEGAERPEQITAREAVGETGDRQQPAIERQAIGSPGTANIAAGHVPELTHEAPVAASSALGAPDTHEQAIEAQRKDNRNRALILLTLLLGD